MIHDDPIDTQRESEGDTAGARSVERSSDDLVFKITDRRSWDQAVGDGTLAASPDDARDGFVHLSAAHQLATTAAKYYVGRTDLVLVAFRAGDLSDHLLWDVSRGGDLFPHYYALLPVERALWAEPLPLDATGRPRTTEVIAVAVTAGDHRTLGHSAAPPSTDPIIDGTS